MESRESGVSQGSSSTSFPQVMLWLLQLVSSASPPVECLCRINDFFEDYIRINSTIVLDGNLQEDIVLTIRDCHMGSQRFRCDPDSIVLEAMDQYSSVKSTVLVVNLREVVTTFPVTWRLAWIITLLFLFLLLFAGIYHNVRDVAVIKEGFKVESNICNDVIQDTSLEAKQAIVEDEIFQEVEKIMRLPKTDAEWRDFFEQIYRSGFWEHQNNSNNKDI